MLKLDILQNGIDSIAANNAVFAAKLTDLSTTADAIVAKLGAGSLDQAAIDDLAGKVASANEALNGNVQSLGAITQQLKDAVTPPQG